jgi:hypothetical protein
MVVQASSSGNTENQQELASWLLAKFWGVTTNLGSIAGASPACLATSLGNGTCLSVFAVLIVLAMECSLKPITAIFFLAGLPTHAAKVHIAIVWMDTMQQSHYTGTALF